MAYNQPYYGYYPQYNNGASPDMLNQFKGQYQQPMQPMQMPIQQPQIPASGNEFLWVLGEVEATSYPVAPNNTVTLWDKNQPTIYIKSANAQGVPSIRILDFTERASNTPKTPENHTCKCEGKYVPLNEFDALKSKLEALEAKLEEMNTKQTTKTAKKTEAE